jgi:hypothetical protein
MFFENYTEEKKCKLNSPKGLMKCESMEVKPLRNESELTSILGFDQKI